MQFVKWLNSQSPTELSKRLGIGVYPIFHWRNGRSLPRPDTMVKLVKLSKGKVSYEAIIKHYVTASVGYKKRKPRTKKLKTRRR